MGHRFFLLFLGCLIGFPGISPAEGVHTALPMATNTAVDPRNPMVDWVSSQKLDIDQVTLVAPERVSIRIGKRTDSKSNPPESGYQIIAFIDGKPATNWSAGWGDKALKACQKLEEKFSGAVERAKRAHQLVAVADPGAAREFVFIPQGVGKVSQVKLSTEELLTQDGTPAGVFVTIASLDGRRVATAVPTSPYSRLFSLTDRAAVQEQTEYLQEYPDWIKKTKSPDTQVIVDSHFMSNNRVVRFVTPWDEK